MARLHTNPELLRAEIARAHVRMEAAKAGVKRALRAHKAATGCTCGMVIIWARRSPASGGYISDGVDHYACRPCIAGDACIRNGPDGVTGEGVRHTPDEHLQTIGVRLLAPFWGTWDASVALLNSAEHWLHRALVRLALVQQESAQIAVLSANRNALIRLPTGPPVLRSSDAQAGSRIARFRAAA